MMDETSSGENSCTCKLINLVINRYNSSVIISALIIYAPLSISQPPNSYQFDKTLDVNKSNYLLVLSNQ